MASSSGAVSNESILHPVWRKLPMELVEDVLKHVPFESLVRFRAVCKKFNALITLPRFARKCQRQQAWKPVPMIVRKSISLDSRPCSIEIFNSETNSWLTHPLPILEANLYPLTLSAASGGLLCFDTGVYGKFVVYNPLTGALRVLEFLNPSDDDDFSKLMFCFRRAFTGLVVDPQAGTFTLVLVSSRNGKVERKTFLYDSVDGSWRVGTPSPDKGHFINFLTITSNGNMYGLVSFMARMDGFYTLLKYNVCNDSWSKFPLPNIESKRLTIIEHRRQVIFVSTATKFGRLLANNDYQIEFAMTFYKVNEATTGPGETLVEERVLFQTWFENVDSLNRWIVSADVVPIGIGDVICIDRGKNLDYPLQVLHFNCTTQKFSWLPHCLRMKPNRLHGGVELKLLEPSLTVDL